MGVYQHNNPWAEKLLQVSLPDGDEAWRAMESRLDAQGPRWRNRDTRRWVLLILLLLLLIGICNCPGRGRLFRGNAMVSREAAPVAPAASALSPTPDGQVPTPVAPASDRIIPGPIPPASRSVQAKAGGQRHDTPSTPAPKRPSTSGLLSTPVPTGESTPTSATSLTPAPTRSTASRDRAIRTGTVSGAKPFHPGHKGQAGQKKLADKSVGSRLVSVTSDPGRSVTGNSVAAEEPSSPGTPAQPGTPSTPGVPMPPGNRTVPPVQPPHTTSDSAGKQPGRSPTISKGSPAKDSTKKKPPVPPKEETQKEKDNGFMAAIGLNQFFPLGGQQSAYNSSGATGTLSDYLPVPVLRYYFNRKLYVQLEAQFNTPQATKKNLVISAPPPDTTTRTGQQIVSSASIQQLFYFNIPLSVHYTAFDNFDIGAGLQLSRLTNAIGAFDSTITPILITNTPVGTSDTIKAVKSFKGDALYQKIKSDEFRLLLDVNYTYKHFIAGLRYNLALSKFVDIQLASGQVAQGRNSSLQLYLRYILWDGRKKRVSPAK